MISGICLFGFSLGVIVLVFAVIIYIGKVAGGAAVFLFAMVTSALGAVGFWWIGENSEKVVHRFKKVSGDN